jgi:hypothetical protein
MISVGPSTNAKASVSMTFDQIAEASIVSGMPIKSFSASEWLDTGAPDVLSAPWIGTLKITGRRAKPKANITALTGDFEADLNLTGANAALVALNKLQVAGGLKGATIQAAGNIGKLSVKGDMVQSFWDVQGDIGSIVVAGAARGSRVRSGGSIRSVRLGASFDSDFLAGMSSNSVRYPGMHDDFENVLAKIGSLRITGWKIPRGVEKPRFFSNSNLSAANLGTISLLNGDFEANGIYYLANGGSLKKIKHTDKADPGDNWTYPPKPGYIGAPPNLIHPL